MIQRKVEMTYMTFTYNTVTQTAKEFSTKFATWHKRINTLANSLQTITSTKEEQLETIKRLEVESSKQEETLLSKYELASKPKPSLIP